MYNHEPEGYDCPFCRIARGRDDEERRAVHPDVVYSNAYVTAFIAANWFRNNPGHVLIVPNRHVENLYDLPDDLSIAVHSLEREIALALKKVYECDGTSSRQHNEPAGFQHVWHYHLHVFPRYPGDDLYRSEFRGTSAEERLPYAEKLRAYFEGVAAG